MDSFYLFSLEAPFKNKIDTCLSKHPYQVMFPTHKRHGWSSGVLACPLVLWPLCSFVYFPFLFSLSALYACQIFLELFDWLTCGIIHFRDRLWNFLKSESTHKKYLSGCPSCLELSFYWYSHPIKWLRTWALKPNILDSNSGSGFGQVMKPLCASVLPPGHGNKNSPALTEMLRIMGQCLAALRALLDSM